MNSYLVIPTPTTNTLLFRVQDPLGSAISHTAQQKTDMPHPDMGVVSTCSADQQIILLGSVRGCGQAGYPGSPQGLIISSGSLPPPHTGVEL